MDEITLLRQIADAAFTARDRQRTYFRTRDRHILQMSKDAEQHLDKLITQHREMKLQPDLFADPAQPP